MILAGMPTATAWGDVFEDDGIGADFTVVAEGDVAKDDGAAADVDAVFDDGEFKVVVEAGNAEGGVLADVGVIADAAAMEDHAAVVPEADAAAEFDGVGERDAAEPFDLFVQYAIEEGEGEAEEFGADGHAGVAKTVDGDGPEALFEEFGFVGAVVFAEEREEAEFGRVLVFIATGEFGDFRFFKGGGHGHSTIN